MLKILGIGGSSRKGGNSDILLEHIPTGARSTGAETEEVQLRDYRFQSCIGCEKCREAEQCIGLKDDMQLVYPKIMESKGLVLISPTHNYNVTALMKAFIDRLYCFYNFTDKRPGGWSSRLAGQSRKVIIASIGEQTDEGSGIGFTLDAMRLPGIKEQPELLRRAERLGKQLANRLAGI